MDVSRYLELKVAPRAVFDHLEERRTRVRFMKPTASGDWDAVTWGAFAREIEEIAFFLSSAGLKNEQRAALLAPNRVEWMSAALGIQAAGGVMVPIYPSSTQEQVAYVVEHSDARYLFVDTAPLLKKLLGAWSQLHGVERIVVLDDQLDVASVVDEIRTQGGSVPSYAEIERKLVSWSRALQIGRDRKKHNPQEIIERMNALSLDAPALMLYTSGTSGPPKGVPLTHRNVGVNGRDWLTINAPLLEENDVDLLWLPFSHIFGFGEACLGNTLGFTSYLSDPLSVLERLPEVKPNVFMSVPAYWDKLAQAALAEESDKAQNEKLKAITGGRLRFCLSGGAGLNRQVKELFHRQGILIVEGYGLTEASPTLTLNRPDAFRFDSVGKPLPSVEIKLAEDGEILARGPNVFAGYHKNPAATAEAFTEDGWLKTGDVGRFTDDGFLQIVDRKKDILVTAGGKNVAPQNIELRFRDDSMISNLVVYGDGRKYLVAGVWLFPHLMGQLDDSLKARVARRIEEVNGRLASFETIKKFVIIEEPLTVENGLLTPTLKIKRKKIYETFKDQLEALYQ